MTAFGMFMDVLFIPSNFYYCISGRSWGVQSFRVDNDSTKQSSQFLTFEFQKKTMFDAHNRDNSIRGKKNQAAEGPLACYF